MNTFAESWYKNYLAIMIVHDFSGKSEFDVVAGVLVCHPTSTHHSNSRRRSTSCRLLAGFKIPPHSTYVVVKSTPRALATMADAAKRRRLTSGDHAGFTGTWFFPPIFLLFLAFLNSNFFCLSTFVGAHVRHE
jgi:hypothetical protein